MTSSTGSYDPTPAVRITGRNPLSLQEFRISQGQEGDRIDVQVSTLSGLTRSQIRRCSEKGLLLVNGKAVRQNYRTRAGDVVTLSLPFEEQSLIPEDLPVEIVYKDDALIVVNKPPDMVVYPAAGHSRGTLMNVVAHHSGRLASVGGPLRPGVVHRLDRDTSGIMVIALDDRAYYHLVEQFRERSISRQYRAVVYGNMREDSGEISLSIGRSASDRKKMSTKSRRGKVALTRWKVIERFHNATLIEARLGTGRTHQIRVHLASLGHPVLGDRTYGKKTVLEIRQKKIFFRRQMLHAESLGFVHPLTGVQMEFTRGLPEDMEEKIRELRELA